MVECTETEKELLEAYLQEGPLDRASDRLQELTTRAKMARVPPAALERMRAARAAFEAAHAELLASRSAVGSVHWQIEKQWERDEQEATRKRLAEAATWHRVGETKPTSGQRVLCRRDGVISVSYFNDATPEAGRPEPAWLGSCGAYLAPEEWAEMPEGWPW